MNTNIRDFGHNIPVPDSSDSYARMLGLIASTYSSQKNLDLSSPLVGELSELEKMDVPKNIVSLLENKLGDDGNYLNMKIGRSFVRVTHHEVPGYQPIIAYQQRQPCCPGMSYFS